MKVICDKFIQIIGMSGKRYVSSFRFYVITDILISSRVDFIAYVPEARIRHRSWYQELQPRPATLTMFVDVGQLILFTIVVADLNWKGMPDCPLNLPACTPRS